MSLPTVHSHFADVTNIDTTTITFDLPADVQAGDGLIAIVGSWDDDTGADLTAPAGWTVLDTAADKGQVAEALLIGRVAVSGDEGSTVTVTSPTATAIVNVFVIRNWYGDFTDGFATVAHDYFVAGNGTPAYSSPAITVGWPSGDQHLVVAWAVAGRSGGDFVTTPAGYTVVANGLNSTLNTSRGIAVGTGHKELLSLTDNPGDWQNDTDLLDRYAGTFAIRGIAGSDTTPPTFDSAPAVTATTDSGHTISSTLDEAGTKYGVRLASGATAPSSAQVKAGQDSTGSLASESDSVAASAGVSCDLVFSTGSASTAYDYYIVAEDDETTPNIQASPTLVSATTAAAPVPGLPSYTLNKDGSVVGSLTGVKIRVTATGELDGTELYSVNNATTTAGALSAIDLSATAATVGDTVSVSILTGANEGISFTDTVEDVG